MELNDVFKTSVAVLPFRNISPSEDYEFFSDGITEEIINALSKVEQLKVTSRTSSFYFKNHQTSIKEISNQLDVSIILEGSVRINQDKLRISAQLINVEEDSNFWSETWDRTLENIFEVQDEISLLIADKLREDLGHLEISDHLVESSTANLKAYQHHLKGQYHINKWNPEDVNIAIKEFEKAVALDDQLIDSYVGIADAYSFMAVAGFAPREEAWMKANEAMQVAIRLDPNHAGLNFMLANQAFFTEGDYAKALEYGLKSLASKPTFSQSHRMMSFFYTLPGNLKKAQTHILFAKSIDPLNPETRFFEANYYYQAGDYSKSLAMIEDLLRENEKNLPAIVVRLWILIKENRLEAATAAIENTPIELLTPDERLGLLCLVDLAGGNTSSPLLSELEAHAKAPIAHHAHSYLFIAYTFLERNDDAFKVLEKLFDQKSSILLLGFGDPLSEKIRTDERYMQYHARVYPEVVQGIPAKKSRPNSLDEQTAQSIIAKLKAYMEAEDPYLNPALTLRGLANQLSIHPNQLSRLLNENIGKNFNEYINQMRIEHFKELVVDPANSHISLIGLAYESGFNSKTVFNTTFKKMVGMTPGAFQKSQA